MNSDGETRANRNEKFGQEDEIKYPDVPDHFEYIWEWFWELTDAGRHVYDGVAVSLSYSELTAWITGLDQIVTHEEKKIIIKMSQAWSDEMNEEIQSQRAANEDN